MLFRSRRLEQAARTLGASRWRAYATVTLPLALPGVLAGAVLGFARSIGEFGATVFLARPDRPTLPVAIFRFLGRPGELNAAEAYALAVVLMLVTGVAVFAVERVRAHRGGWV